MQENKEKVKDFISRYFRNHELGDDEDIFAAGFVNSLFAMQLVLFLEQEFKINVDSSDLDLSNFKTINAITDFVKRKTA